MTAGYAEESPGGFAACRPCATRVTRLRLTYNSPELPFLQEKQVPSCCCICEGQVRAAERLWAVLVHPAWFLSVLLARGASPFTPSCVLGGEKGAGSVGAVQVEPQFLSRESCAGKQVQGGGMPPTGWCEVYFVEAQSMSPTHSYSPTLG